MRKKLMLLIAISLLIFTGCAGQEEQITEELNVEVVSLEPIPVQTELVTIDTIKETFYGVGELKAKNEIEIMTGRPGTIEEIYVNVGQIVEKDQVLMKLSNDNLIASVTASESNLSTQMNISEINLDAAQITFDQVQALYEMGASSQSDMDDARNNLQQAQLNYNNAVNNYNATMKNLNDEVSDTFVKSPIDGVVAAAYVDLNQDVQNVMAFKIVNAERLIASIEVPETLVNTIEIGQTTHIYLNGDKDNRIKGHVTSIDAVPGQNSFLYPVEIEVDNTDGQMRSGMYIEAEVITNERHNRVLVPKSALLGTQDHKYVFVDEGGYAVNRAVEIGFDKSGQVEIVNGLAKGDVLVVRGHEYLEEGDLLKSVDKED